MMFYICLLLCTSDWRQLGNDTISLSLDNRLFITSTQAIVKGIEEDQREDEEMTLR